MVRPAEAAPSLGRQTTQASQRENHVENPTMWKFLRASQQVCACVCMSLAGSFGYRDVEQRKPKAISNPEVFGLSNQELYWQPLGEVSGQVWEWVRSRAVDSGCDILQNWMPSFLISYCTVSKVLKRKYCWEVTSSFRYNPTEHVCNSCCYHQITLEY